MAERIRNFFQFRKPIVKKSGGGFRRSHSLRMDKIKRTFSFRKKKDHVPESSKPHQWQEDERKVREGSCSFQVRYLGCVEVYESRGMQVCEEAVKALKQNKSKHQRAVLYVSGDALRVVDEIRKGLIVDQTIEKVSFCAPDRGHDKGFAYICRDGTTRRWMCHGFMAVKESVSGERLSHAVGCAFAICLERKQKRDKESGVTVTFNEDKTSFTRTGSFRQTTMTERLQDPQSAIIAEPVPAVNLNMSTALERPHATDTMLQKMGSFRGFPKLQNASSPFKRQMSLPVRGAKAQAQFDLDGLRNGAGGEKRPPSPIREEVSPTKETPDQTIAEMCQQLSQGLTELSGPNQTQNGSNGAGSAQHQHSAMVHSSPSHHAAAAAAPISAPQVNNHTPTQFQATFPSSQASSNHSASAFPVRQSNPWGSPDKHQQNHGTFWLRDDAKPAPREPATTVTAPASSDRLLHPFVDPFQGAQQPAPPPRAPQLQAGARSHSIDTGDCGPQAQRAPTLREMSATQRNWQSVSASQPPVDPFDIAWAERATNQSPAPSSTNPFVQGNTVTAFKVQL